MRRVSLALLVSLGVHAAIAVAAFGVAVWRGLSFTRNVEVVPITLESVKDLPLGPPPAATRPSVAVVAPPPRRPRVTPQKTGSLPTENRDGGAPPDALAARPPPDARPTAPPPKPGDLQAYGPEGSKLNAILRLDRLRASPEGRQYIGPVDEILRLLPDRRRLLEGTGLDLYRDFDALLIATPNPFDDTVTFLAARHRLDDEGIRAALDRGAAAAGRPIVWRQEAGRPVGVRTSPREPPPAGQPAAPAAVDRDDRLFVLPQTHLAVIAPPAYAKLLLASAAPASSGRGRGDGGAPAAGERPPGRRDWTDLVARIDAEDGALPEHAVFMLTATNLLRATEGRAGITEDGSAKVAGVPAALPKVITLVAGTSPTSFVELTATFSAATQARAWEAEWPGWKQKLLGNPLVLLAGLNPIVSRAELERDDDRVVLRTSANPEETRRILQMIVNFARGGLP
jgi:hypothetical protein